MPGNDKNTADNHGVKHSAFAKSFAEKKTSRFIPSSPSRYTLEPGKALNDFTSEQQTAMLHDYMDVAMRGGGVSTNCRNGNTPDAKKMLQNIIETAIPSMKEQRQSLAAHNKKMEPPRPS